MIVRTTSIEGVMLVETDESQDERGRFARTFDEEIFARAGLETRFPQHSIAFNEVAGTIRGLHYQCAPHAEAKVVRCLAGAFFDVAVDMRPLSATYGCWFGTELSAANRSALYIPVGCAHGYQTLVDGTQALYLISSPYVPAAARGIHYADPELAIPWPIETTRISERDRLFPRFADSAS